MSEEHEHEHEHEHDHDIDEVIDEALAMELGTQTQIFLELRQQNMELLQLAAQVAGYTGNHAPLKHADLKPALRSIWDVYSEFHAWVDPEEDEGDEEDDDE